MENSNDSGTPEKKGNDRFAILMAGISLLVILIGIAIGYGISVGGSLSGLATMASVFPAGSTSSVAASGVYSGTKAPSTTGEREQPASGAWIKVTPEELDFGKVKSTDVVTHSFQIKNAGSDVLKISTITTSCGCTTAKAGKMSLQPGETTDLLVTYNPGHHSSVTPGPVRRLIYIDSNDPSAPEIKIPVTAFVVKVDPLPTPTNAAPPSAQAGG
jgi:hypothetical protein